MNDFRAAAERARDLVRDAGRLVFSMQGTVDVRDKGGDLGPVTDADYAAEEILLAGLRETFPGDAILSEESHQQVDMDAPRIWCVDPLDGTRDYARGRGEYAVQMGLLVDGEPVAGAVAIPNEGRVFWGWKGGGVFSDDGPVHPATPATRHQVIAIHSRTRGEGVKERLQKLGIEHWIAVGGCGYKVSRLLTGDAHLYLHARGGTTWWDTVGPASLVLAVDGSIGDASGAPLDYRTSTSHARGLLFTSPGTLDLLPLDDA